MRPIITVAFLNKITETVPFKFTLGDGTSQFYLSFADANHFPVAFARAGLDKNLLPDLEWVWSESYNGLHLPLSCLSKNSGF